LSWLIDDETITPSAFIPLIPVMETYIIIQRVRLARFGWLTALFSAGAVFFSQKNQYEL